MLSFDLNFVSTLLGLSYLSGNPGLCSPQLTLFFTLCLQLVCKMRWELNLKAVVN